MINIRPLLICLTVITLLSVSLCIPQAHQKDSKPHSSTSDESWIPNFLKPSQIDSDETYQELEKNTDFLKPSSPPSPKGSKKSPVVNPKKSPIPAGPPVTPLPWNQTHSGYFGGWGQLVTTDVHHFYINSEQIAETLSEAVSSKPVVLQLVQHSLPTPDSYVKLFMSHSEYPNEINHMFSCDTKSQSSVHIKVPPLKHKFHWIVRIQPSKPISVWSSTLDYSLVLFEKEQISQVQSSSFTLYLITFLMTVIAAAASNYYFIVLPRRKHEEALISSQNASNSITYLNDDMKLMPLSEAQKRAKEGELEQKDAIVRQNTATSYDLNKQIDEIIKRQVIQPVVNPTPVKTPPKIFIRSPENQLNKDITLKDLPSSSTETSTINTTAGSSAPTAAAATLVTASNAKSTPPPTMAKPLSAVAPKVKSPAAAPKKESNVQKMTAFWAQPNK